MSNSFPSSDSIFGFAWLQLDPFNRSLSGGGQQEHQKCLAKVCLGWLTSFLSSSPSLKKTRTMTAITTPTHLHSSLFVHRLSLFFNGPECYFFVFLSGRFFFFLLLYPSHRLFFTTGPFTLTVQDVEKWTQGKETDSGIATNRMAIFPGHGVAYQSTRMVHFPRAVTMSSVCAKRKKYNNPVFFFSIDFHVLLTGKFESEKLVADCLSPQTRIVSWQRRPGDQ